ncbi:peptidyl-prolyl cis-trans isomerase [Planktothrix agardhii CCAP 1459/11A]|uniref:Peptidyl-prolyl cis-trans isomerase n=1 Tax=Planktothrix agardhii CCAP 1459/11A TaxID=282420 RepID=A0A479ZR02_PLAAG|nr:choice-of-anchor K domain-containing protein [Planktothrix agardhii]GCL34895.1 peptidyl-prolyl cis-trans isomerase [Planktothrix agardhii CCAP 1459/11A]
MVQASFGEVNFNTWGNNGFQQSRPIDPNQNTYVITHGWNNTGGNAANNFTPADWIPEKAQAYRDLDPNANIVVTDWESGAKKNFNNINYFSAAENTKEAGEKLAEYLKDQGVDPNKTSLIGDSLGAHLSGAAGAKYRELTGNQINFIRALDAAGPGFYGKGPTERLDPSDAKQVEAWHGSTSLGYPDPIGTRDIYINDKLLAQPGGLPVLGSHGYPHRLETSVVKGESFAQADGTRFDLNRLSSPETGRIDIDTTNPNFTVSTSGTFEGGSNKFSLGIPEFVSFVQFDGIPRTLIGTNSPFELGKLTYKNGENAEDSPRSIDTTLNINLSITQPENIPQTFNFAIKNQATDNTTGDAVLDADRLLFSGAGLSQERIKVAGVEYTLDLIGFASNGELVGQFDSPENSTPATADLVGEIVPVTILVTDVEQRLKQFGNNINETWNSIRNTIADAKNGILRELVYPLAEAVVDVLIGAPEIRSARQVNSPTDTGTIFQITEAIMAENPGGVLGSDNNEKILGSPVTDVVFAAGGADTIESAVGNDYLRGGKGIDRILGEDGNDIINGNEGDDFISGGPGNDLVRGGQDNDEIFGNDGDDILIGEKGTDRLTGGVGSDVFILRTDTGIEETNAATADWLLDFNASEGDLIGINGGVPIDILTFTPTDVNQDGIADTIIQYTETNEIIGVYTNIFGVVINTQPDIVKNALFTIPLNDPITQIG